MFTSIGSNLQCKHLFFDKMIKNHVKSMVYAMVCFENTVLLYDILMLLNEIYMLCCATVYVIKDLYACIECTRESIINMFFHILQPSCKKASEYLK